MAEFKKPQDYSNKVPSSVFNLSHTFSSTIFQGLNVPIKFEKVRAGDKWSIDMADLVQSDPMLGPMKGAFRVTYSVWFESDFNLYGWMRDNDQQTTSEILTADRHTFQIPVFPSGSANTVLLYDVSPIQLAALRVGDYVGYEEVRSVGVGGLKNFRDPSVFGPGTNVTGTSTFRDGAVARGSLLDFIGIPPCYQNPSTDRTKLPSFCADFVLAYLDIMRCGFTNTQTRFSDSHGTSFIPAVGNRLSMEQYYASPETPDYGPRNLFFNVPLDHLDGFFKWLRSQDEGVSFDINAQMLQPGYQNMDFLWNPYSFGTDEYWKYFFARYIAASCLPHGGLFAAQFRPDVYRNLLSVDVGKTKSYVSTSDGQFSIDTLRFQNKLQRVIDRYDISGGRISSWLRTLWGVETRRRFSTPELLGVMSHVMDARTITAVAQTGSVGGADSTDIGTMRGNVDDVKKHKRISFTASEPGTLVVIAQLVPIVSYCQNIRPELREINFADEYNPEFAQLGYQDVPLSDYSALSTSSNAYWEGDYQSLDTYSIVGADLQKVIGRNVAWVHLMTSTNRVHGEYSTLGSRDYWTLQRRYTRYFEKILKIPTVHGEFDPEDLSSGTFYYDGITEHPVLGATTNISPYVDPMDFQYMFADQTMLDPHWHLDVWFDCKVVRKLGKRFMPNLERND